MSLHFEEETHTYTLLDSGVVLPSVSDIIAPLVDLSKIPKSNLEFARDRGKAVHKACELLDLGTLDRSDLDPQLAPYVAAWEKFVHDFGVTFTEIEQPGYHKTMMYAGTPDRWAIIKRKNILLDMKATAQLSPAVQVQLTGYSAMSERKADGLWSVRLLPNGTYERKVHAPAMTTFMSCYNIFMWKRKNA